MPPPALGPYASYDVPEGFGGLLRAYVSGVQIRPKTLRSYAHLRRLAARKGVDARELLIHECMDQLRKKLSMSACPIGASILNRLVVCIYYNRKLAWEIPGAIREELPQRIVGWRIRLDCGNAVPRVAAD
jgi:hypothetical protein